MNQIQIAIGLLLTIWALSGCSSIRALTTANAPTLSPAEHLALGQSYASNGQADLAMQQYNAAVAQNKKYVPALMALGNLAYENKQYDVARKHFERALKYAPRDPAVINNVAMVDLAEGKSMAKSTAKLEDALSAPGPMRPYLLDTLATIALREGRFLDAKLLLNQATEAVPADNPELYKSLQKSQDKLAAVTR
jgi:Tfp pilus assembly protein PilF